MAKNETVKYYNKGSYLGEITIKPRSIHFEPSCGLDICDAVRTAFEISTKYNKTVQLSFNDVKLNIGTSKKTIIQNAVAAYHNGMSLAYYKNMKQK